MRITIDTASPLSALDAEVLNLLLLEAQASKATTKTAAAEVKAAAAVLATKEPEPTAESTESAEEPEPTGRELEVTKETMDAAVAKAKALIQDGDKAKVRKALESAGLARVGAIETEDQGQKFLQALGG